MPENRLKAVIWDMDGVIVDSGPYHRQAWQEVFDRRGVAFSKEDFKRVFGQRNDSIIRNHIGRSISDEEVAAMVQDKETGFRRRVASHIKAFPGVVRLMEALRAQGVKMAIASSAPPENITLITRELGLTGYLDAVVWGGEVSEGKPSPLGFLLAAEKLEIASGDCVVIEDAVAGVTAARQAGMKCVAVTNTHPAESLAGADLVVDTLEKVGVADLAGLFIAGGQDKKRGVRK